MLKTISYNFIKSLQIPKAKLLKKILSDNNISKKIKILDKMEPSEKKLIFFGSKPDNVSTISKDPIIISNIIWLDDNDSIKELKRLLNLEKQKQYVSTDLIKRIICKQKDASIYNVLSFREFCKFAENSDINEFCTYYLDLLKNNTPLCSHLTIAEIKPHFYDIDPKLIKIQELIIKTLLINSQIDFNQTRCIDIKKRACQIYDVITPIKITLEQFLEEYCNQSNATSLKKANALKKLHLLITELESTQNKTTTKVINTCTATYAIDKTKITNIINALYIKDTPSQKDKLKTINIDTLTLKALIDYCKNSRAIKENLIHHITEKIDSQIHDLTNATFFERLQKIFEKNNDIIKELKQLNPLYKRFIEQKILDINNTHTLIKQITTTLHQCKTERLLEIDSLINDETLTNNIQIPDYETCITKLNNATQPQSSSEKLKNIEHLFKKINTTQIPLPTDQTHEKIINELDNIFKSCGFNIETYNEFFKIEDKEIKFNLALIKNSTQTEIISKKIKKRAPLSDLKTPLNNLYDTKNIFNNKEDTLIFPLDLEENLMILFKNCGFTDEEINKHFTIQDQNKLKLDTKNLHLCINGKIDQKIKILKNQKKTLEEFSSSNEHDFSELNPILANHPSEFQIKLLIKKDTLSTLYSKFAQTIQPTWLKKNILDIYIESLKLITSTPLAIKLEFKNILLHKLADIEHIITNENKHAIYQNLFNELTINNLITLTKTPPFLDQQINIETLEKEKNTLHKLITFIKTIANMSQLTSFGNSKTNNRTINRTTPILDDHNAEIKKVVQTILLDKETLKHIDFLFCYLFSKNFYLHKITNNTIVLFFKNNIALFHTINEKINEHYQDLCKRHNENQEELNKLLVDHLEIFKINYINLDAFFNEEDILELNNHITTFNTPNPTKSPTLISQKTELHNAFLYFELHKAINTPSNKYDHTDNSVEKNIITKIYKSDREKYFLKNFLIQLIHVKYKELDIEDIFKIISTLLYHKSPQSTQIFLPKTSEITLENLQLEDSQIKKLNLIVNSDKTAVSKKTSLHDILIISLIIEKLSTIKSLPQTQYALHSPTSNTSTPSKSKESPKYYKKDNLTLEIQEDLMNTKDITPYIAEIFNSLSFVSTSTLKDTVIMTLKNLIGLGRSENLNTYWLLCIIAKNIQDLLEDKKIKINLNEIIIIDEDYEILKRHIMLNNAQNEPFNINKKSDLKRLCQKIRSFPKHNKARYNQQNTP